MHKCYNLLISYKGSNGGILMDIILKTEDTQSVIDNLKQITATLEKAKDTPYDKYKLVWGILKLLADKEWERYNQMEYASLTDDIQSWLLFRECLTERENAVFILRSGLIGGIILSDEELADFFVITTKRVQQFYAKAIRKLHHPHTRRRHNNYLD